MIVTVTLNPAIDQTLWLDRLTPGHVNRPSRSQLDPAGKGINASRIVHRLGRPTIALGFAAGRLGDKLRDALTAEGVQHQLLHLDGETRIDVTVVEASGVATSLYAPGPPVTAHALVELDQAIDYWLGAAHTLVLGGSLLPGTPTDFYARQVERARSRGVRTVIDAGGEALRLAVAARPDVVKPNRHEAGALLGRTLTDDQAVMRAALELRDGGIGTVIISLGAQGSICAAEAGLFRAVPAPVTVRSTVGSGDSMVGALAVAMSRGDSTPDALRLGSAAGAATAAAAGTSLGTAAAIAALLPTVRVDELDARSAA